MLNHSTTTTTGPACHLLCSGTLRLGLLLLLTNHRPSSSSSSRGRGWGVSPLGGDVDGLGHVEWSLDVLQHGARQIGASEIGLLQVTPSKITILESGEKQNKREKITVKGV